jgi:hypothetical protein
MLFDTVTFRTRSNISILIGKQIVHGLTLVDYQVTIKFKVKRLRVCDAGAVMSREMYALIGPQPFHCNIKPTTDIADFPPRFMADRVTHHYHTLGKKSSPSPLSLPLRRIMWTQGSISFELCWTPLINMLLTHTKLRPSLRLTPSDGTP